MKKVIDEIKAGIKLENYSFVYVKDMAYFIGWNETLGGINMRYFVCPPK